MAPLFFDHLVIKTEIIELIKNKPEPENQKGKALTISRRYSLSGDHRAYFGEASSPAP